MMGSASIKSVLHAFITDFNYEALKISDGYMASRNYFKEEEREERCFDVYNL
jgi:hypothetical protein